MPVDVTPSTVATQQLQMIPFGNLIGAPLDAAIKAQANAALSTVDFIQAVGLQEAADGSLQAITVTFTYNNSNGIAQNLVVPLLAIIPVPYIAIDDMTIDFKANISAESSSSTSVAETTSYSGNVKGSVGWWWWKTDFNANYSSKKDSTATANSKYAVEYTMDVRVHAGQADMPKGLATVLQVLGDSIVSRSPTGNLVITLDRNRVDAKGQIINVRIVVVNGFNSGVPGITPTLSLAQSEGSSPYLEVSSAPGNTNNYGETSAVIKVSSLPEGQSVTVTATVKAALGSGDNSLEETFDILVIAGSAGTGSGNGGGTHGGGTDGGAPR